MIKVTPISLAITAGAGTNSYAVCIEVPVIYGATQSMPQISVAYTQGTAFVQGEVVLIPVTANIALQYTNCQGVVTKQQILTEHFTLGITGTALPATSVIQNQGQVINYTSTKCCKSYGLRIDGALQLTTTAA